MTIIRAVARYLRQVPIAFSDRYMERTLVGHPRIAALLVRLFQARFDPDRRDAAATQAVTDEIAQAIDAVQSLDEDRILRSFMTVVRAMLRTNYYRADADGRSLPYLSFKLDPPRSRCCRCRARGMRSSSTRRGWRASTSGAAGWPAAGCGGRTGARTSEPRSWV